MLDIQSGRITLDGVDITRIPHNILRQKCFITISQDTLLLPNETLRFNLDPDGLLGHDGAQDIVNCLKRAGLWSHFSPAHTTANNDKPKTPPYAPLNQPLTSFPPLSSGQAQLLALCRGVLKASALRRDGGRRPVVLLDEVTAALDKETEAVVWGMVEREFVGRGHTVVGVSHRVVGGEGGGGGGDGGGGRVVCMRDGRVEGGD